MHLVHAERAVPERDLVEGAPEVAAESGRAVHPVRERAAVDI